jgi:hypothetical protein
MSFRQFVSDQVFLADAKKLGIRVSLKGDTVSVGRSRGRLSGSQASVTASAPRGTLARSMLQRGWQKAGAVTITIITPDGVELMTSVKDETRARQWVAQYNTRSGAHQ